MAAAAAAASGGIDAQDEIDDDYDFSNIPATRAQQIRATITDILDPDAVADAADRGETSTPEKATAWLLRRMMYAPVDVIAAAIRKDKTIAALVRRHRLGERIVAADMRVGFITGLLTGAAEGFQAALLDIAYTDAAMKASKARSYAVLLDSNCDESLKREVTVREMGALDVQLTNVVPGVGVLPFTEKAPVLVLGVSIDVDSKHRAGDNRGRAVFALEDVRRGPPVFPSTYDAASLRRWLQYALHPRSPDPVASENGLADASWNETKRLRLTEAPRKVAAAAQWPWLRPTSECSDVVSFGPKLMEWVRHQGVANPPYVEVTSDMLSKNADNSDGEDGDDSEDDDDDGDDQDGASYKRVPPRERRTRRSRFSGWKINLFVANTADIASTAMHVPSHEKAKAKLTGRPTPTAYGANATYYPRTTPRFGWNPANLMRSRVERVFDKAVSMRELVKRDHYRSFTLAMRRLVACVRGSGNVIVPQVDATAAELDRKFGQCDRYVPLSVIEQDQDRPWATQHTRDNTWYEVYEPTTAATATTDAAEVGVYLVSMVTLDTPRGVPAGNVWRNIAHTAPIGMFRCDGKSFYDTDGLTAATLRAMVNIEARERVWLEQLDTPPSPQK